MTGDKIGHSWVLGPQVFIRLLKYSRSSNNVILLKGHFFTTLMRCHRSFTLVCINWPTAELVSLHTILLKVTEPINSLK